MYFVGLFCVDPPWDDIGPPLVGERKVARAGEAGFGVQTYVALARCFAWNGLSDCHFGLSGFDQDFRTNQYFLECPFDLSPVFTVLSLSKNN